MSIGEQVLAPADRPLAVSEPGALRLGNGETIAESGRRQLRIALYSPGIAGLGHMRRNLLIGQTLIRSCSEAVILMIAEARQACVFAMPPRMDCLSLPALRKLPDGKVQPRYLGTTLQDLMHLRSTVIHRAIEAFEPDVLIADFLPRGRHGELGTTLEYLRFRTKTRCVLGLRDVLDNPAWARRHANEDEIRDYYDAVWVYGDRAVHDLIRAHDFSPDLQDKTYYTGYLDQRARLECVEDEEARVLEKLELPAGRLVLCLVGGGWDGAPLAEAFVQADLPPETNGVLLTGPYMPPEVRQRLRQRAAGQPRLRVLEFIPEPAPLLQRADRVIAMGGYNTVAEVLSFEKPALIVPRAEEQSVRAERLRELGLVDLLPLSELRSAALTEWMSRDVVQPQVHQRVDFNGLSRLPRLLQEVLAGPSHADARRPYGGVLQHATV
jgi:predicted glycosyltransferase